jgi:hypothetical protein
VLVRGLTFASVYFSESGLFNGLRRIQIKKTLPISQLASEVACARSIAHISIVLYRIPFPSPRPWIAGDRSSDNQDILSQISALAKKLLQEARRASRFVSPASRPLASCGHRRTSLFYLPEPCPSRPAAGRLDPPLDRQLFRLRPSMRLSGAPVVVAVPLGSSQLLDRGGRDDSSDSAMAPVSMAPLPSRFGAPVD